MVSRLADSVRLAAPADSNLQLKMSLQHVGTDEDFHVANRRRQVDINQVGPFPCIDGSTSMLIQCCQHSGIVD